MTLLTKAQTQKLLANCQEQIANNDAGHSDIDFKPVVKLFTPDAQCTWQYPSSAGPFTRPCVRPAPARQTRVAGARARLALRTPSVATSL